MKNGGDVKKKDARTDGGRNHYHRAVR